MLNFNSALKIVLSSIKPIGAESIKISDALNRVLAEDIYSKFDIPLLDNSAMDGFALRSSDTKGASKNNPKLLKVVSDLKAGSISNYTIKKDEAIRIMTGAVIPKGADSVLMVESTQSKGYYVKIFAQTRYRENIRKAGEDIKKGELVLGKGRLLSSADIGMLASLGKSKIKVKRKPKVAILATGDEVIDVGKKFRPGKLYSSNSYTLYNQVIECGAEPINLGISKDNPRQLISKIRKGLQVCNIFVSSGGVSMGVYDFVKDVLIKLGVRIRFSQIAMRPGKPVVFGALRDIPIFGLPGNPASSMISFEFFVRPAILKMMNQNNDNRREVTALLDEDLEKRRGIRYFLRTKTSWSNGQFITKTTGPQGSGILKSMVLANSLIILPEDITRVKKGDRVRVRFLS